LAELWSDHLGSGRLPTVTAATQADPRLYRNTRGRNGSIPEKLAAETAGRKQPLILESCSETIAPNQCRCVADCNVGSARAP
jgi:hypothetical protein